MQIGCIVLDAEGEKLRYIHFILRRTPDATVFTVFTVVSQSLTEPDFMYYDLVTAGFRPQVHKKAKISESDVPGNPQGGRYRSD